VNGRDGEGATALHWLAAGRCTAAAADALSIAGVLLAANADACAVNKQQRTALHLAAAASNLPMVNVFLDQGSRGCSSSLITMQDTEGHTALHLAAVNGALQVIQVLAAAGGDLAHQDPAGFTPLMLLLRHHHTAAAQQLVELYGGGAALAINARESAGGRSALFFAADASPPWAPIVDALLASGASADVQDSSGNTVLAHAICTGRLAVAWQLLPHTSNVKAANSAGEDALNILLTLDGRTHLAAPGDSVGAVVSVNRSAAGTEAATGDSQQAAVDGHPAAGEILKPPASHTSRIRSSGTMASAPSTSPSRAPAGLSGSTRKTPEVARSSTKPAAAGQLATQGVRRTAAVSTGSGKSQDRRAAATTKSSAAAISAGVHGGCTLQQPSSLPGACEQPNTMLHSTAASNSSPSPKPQELIIALLRRGATLTQDAGIKLFKKAEEAGNDELCALVSFQGRCTMVLSAWVVRFRRCSHLLRLRSMPADGSRLCQRCRQLHSSLSS